MYNYIKYRYKHVLIYSIYSKHVLHPASSPAVALAFLASASFPADDKH